MINQARTPIGLRILCIIVGIFLCVILGVVSGLLYQIWLPTAGSSAKSYTFSTLWEPEHLLRFYQTTTPFLGWSGHSTIDSQSPLTITFRTPPPAKNAIGFPAIRKGQQCAGVDILRITFHHSPSIHKTLVFVTVQPLAEDVSLCMDPA